MTLKPVYDEIYTDIDYGPIGTARGFTTAMGLAQTGVKDLDILCVGCGNAYETVYLKMHGANVTTLDFVAPEIEYLTGCQTIGACQNIPFRDNQFDAVICCECLEHIHPDEINQCLSELFRVGQKFEFTIADKPDPYKYDSHLCIESLTWWIDKLESIGYMVLNAQMKPNFALFMKMQDGNYGIRTWRYNSGYYFKAKKG